jgi:ubiquinone/menaquinone biosynthesis C-methylase UbiE
MVKKTYFNTRFSFNAKRDKVWKYICGYLQRFIPENSKVLDIGCGYFNFINNIKAAQKHALDNAQQVVNFASKDVIFHLGSTSEMKDIASDYFNIIFASNILEHLSAEELKAAISQIKRVLKKDGKIIIIQPNFKYSYKVYFDDHTHKQIFTDESLCNLLEENGFVIFRAFPRFLPFSMNSNFPKIGFLIWLYLRSPLRPFAGQMLIIAKKE